MHNSKTTLFAVVLAVAGVCISVSAASAATNQSSKWTWPTDTTEVSQEFGITLFQDVQRVYRGIDIDTQYGDNVYAARKGTVVKADCHDIRQSCEIRIRHGKRRLWRTRYENIHDFQVEVGDTVKKGQLIAKTGGGKRATGNDLHFEVWRKKPVKFKRSTLTDVEKLFVKEAIWYWMPQDPLRFLPTTN